MPKSYGSFDDIEPNDPIKRTQPVTIPCSKCKNKFNVGKQYHELFVRLGGFGVRSDGSLTPRIPKDVALLQLCPGCFIKFEAWIGGL